MAFAKLIYLAIPIPPAVEGAIESTMSHTAANAFRDFVHFLFPDLDDQKEDKEAEMAAFLKERVGRVLELRVREDPRGNMDISLKS